MSKAIRVGKLWIGGNNPVRVQSMCTTPTKDVNATVAQIRELERAGCELVRVAVPDMASAKALKSIRAKISIPLVADIHYSPKLALLAIPHVDKLRLNPGTMPKLREVVKAAKRLPIRVGINSGSLEKGFAGTKVEQMLASVENSINLLESMGHKKIIVGLKSSDVSETIAVNRAFAAKHEYPLHIGLTEAGFGTQGLIKSAVAIGVLLKQGIGSTIRVSLTGNPLAEVEAAYDILRALGLRNHGLEFISCPTCARTSVDLDAIAKSVKQKLKGFNKPLKIAIMGCEVNGPGEARTADFGLAFSKSQGFIFAKGKILKQVAIETAAEEFAKLIMGP
jgi:(E)-4-hydroxy-3-methylbut-2-enyl-diphosphate synthase